MTTESLWAIGKPHRFAIALGLIVAAQLPAQMTGSTPTAAELAKYDKNRNGVIDPDERTVMLRAEARAGDTITLTPFQVTTDKDVGYAAGNTLSGGRVDTPLAITPGSISVMTKEFMEDFGVDGPPANA